MIQLLTNFYYEFTSYVIAPILYHCAVDGYVMAFIFTIMELCDTYAGYKLVFAFIFSGLLLRNYIFSIFKAAITLLGSSQMKDKGVQNVLKQLGSTCLTGLRGALSSIRSVLVKLLI
jgi:hypothetical protein